MTTTAQWADLLRRLKDAKISGASFMGNNIVVGLEGDFYVCILDVGAFRSVRLYNGRLMVSSWNGQRGLNETITAVRRAQLEVKEGAYK